MKFNTKEINKFIKYYKYFIIIRNVLSNYHKIDIKNIKLESINTYDIYNINYDITGIKYLNITFILNNILINIKLQIKSYVYVVSISNFSKINYKFNYNLIKNNNYIKNYIRKKYCNIRYNILLNKDILSKKIISKDFLLIL